MEYLAGLFCLMAALYPTGLAFGLGFSWFWLWALQKMHNGLPADFLDICGGRKSEGPLNFFDRIHILSMKHSLDAIMWLGIFSGVEFSLGCLWKIASDFGQLSPFRKIGRLLRHIFLWILKPISCKLGEFGFDKSMWVKGIEMGITKQCLCLELCVYLLLSPLLFRPICETFRRAYPRFYGWHYHLRCCRLFPSWYSISDIPGT